MEKTFQLTNRGLVQSVEPASLESGQYSNLQNITSVQEGAVAARFGSRKFNNSNSFGVIHTLAKLGLGGSEAADPRYIGDGGVIWRVTGGYTVYVNVTEFIGLNFTRWESQAYNPGDSGSPTMFFAHQTRMMRDNGAFAKLRPWGIRPPTRPVVATLADPALANYNGLFVLTSQSSGTDRLTGITVSSAVEVTPKYYRITTNSMDGIAPGMYVRVTIGGSPTFVVVDAVDATSFYAYCSSVPSSAVDSFYNKVDHQSDGTPVGTLTANGDGYYSNYTASVDWSFNGNPTEGYDSEDPVHFGLYVSDIPSVKEIRFRVFLDGSTSNYYEKAVAVPQTQGFVDTTATGSAAQQARADLIATGVFGDSQFPDPISIGLRPVEIVPTAIPVWQEFNVPKNEFLKVGSAGIGQASWKTVTSVQVFVISNSITGAPTFDVLVGAIYALGGQGPDSESVATAEPYDYLYTPRNPSTGEEGNPCAPMVQEYFVHSNRRAIQVVCGGFDTDALTGNPGISGPGSLAIYRRGGVFADGFYRFVGYATNPGVGGGLVPNPLTPPFIDNQPDSAIESNRTIEFDNFPPVPSSPRIPFAGVIDTIGAGVNQFVTITLKDYPNYPGVSDMNTYFSVGSTVRIGKGTNEEVVTVQRVGTAKDIDVWVQRQHYSAESVICDFIVGQPCDIVCQYGDALLVAGDPSNPHVVYRSKAGRPSSFPGVLNLETGNNHTLIVGAPDNPINGLVEYNGEVVSLNLRNIYTFQVWQGVMTNPLKTPASRGMSAKHCWCKVDNAIWYLSYDGIYAWSGGESVKITGAIDWMFRKQVIGGIQPLDYQALQYFQMFYAENQVWIIYRDLTGKSRVLRYSIPMQRWEFFNFDNGTVDSTLTCGMVEEDTTRILGAIFIGSGTDRSFLHQLEVGTSDSWASSINDGNAIAWSFKTGFYSPDGRTSDHEFQDIVVELENPSDSVGVRLYYDWSDTVDGTDQFVIAPAAGRRHVPLPLQQAASSTFGKQARAIACEFVGTARGKVVCYSLEVRWNPLAQIQRGLVGNWNSIDHPWDKRLYQMSIEFNTKGQPVTLILDTRSGIDGTTSVNAAQSFILPAFNGKTRKVFAVNDGIIAKEIRLRPVVTSADFDVFDISWVKENYPPDITSFTEYQDDGSPYDKYWQQLTLDVNTNGQTVTVNVEVDGTVRQTLLVSSTLQTRRQVFTLNDTVLGRNARIVVTGVPFSGMFQLFGHSWVTQPADKGPVAHTSDWDELGHPWDKKLRTVTIEYDGSAGAVVLNFDTLTGIDGTTQNPNALSFTLTGTGRSKQTFAIPDGFIVKMVRCHPASNTVAFKQWKYFFDFDKYPADTIRWTEWNGFGYEHDKILQEVAFDVDTGGVAATVQIQADGGTLQTISVTTTTNNREAIVTVNPTLTGKKFRLLVTPGGGGKFQLWDWKPKFEKGDVGPVEHSFDWDDLGAPYDKRLLNVTFEYDTGGNPITMLCDTIGGINGSQMILAAQSFTLNGAGRSKQNFSFAIDTIAKMVRFRPASTFSTLKVWKYVINKLDYPPDTTPGTEWSDFGYEHEKILQELAFDVDTGGVACAIAVQADGATQQTIAITTSSNNRETIYTINPEIRGKKFRMVFTPGGGGKVQLFDWKPKFLKGDPGPVEHSFDYDDLGTPYDKRLLNVTFEYDTGGSPITMVADTITGVNGTAIALAVQSFVLVGSGRSKQTFSFALDTIVKMIRFRPLTTFSTLRVWKYVVNKVDYPPDTTPGTEWDNLGYECEKILREITIDIDTGGVAASLDLQVDGASRQTFSVSTTSTDRSRILTVNSDIIGKLFRIVPTAGGGGKAQIFGVKYNDLKEPCALTHWDSYETVMGFSGYKWLKQMWFEYMCAGAVLFSIYRDGDQLFYQKTLPLHAHRDIENFLLPDVDPITTHLNTSKTYRFVVDAVDVTKPFKFYIGGTRVEYMNRTGDQREAFHQHVLWEDKTIE